MGSAGLVLKLACEGCGSESDLYGTGCKHTTLCSDCGKSMARSRARCLVCSAPITRLIREYNVRANSVMDKTYSIGRFVTGLPPFSKKKNAENKWSLHKEGVQGRQITENMRCYRCFGKDHIRNESSQDEGAGFVTTIWEGEDIS